jgi:hypothetical protein
MEIVQSTGNVTSASITEYDVKMYGFNDQKLETTKYQKLWMKDPKVANFIL